MNIKQICMYNQNDFFHKFTKHAKILVDLHSISICNNRLLMPIQLQLKLTKQLYNDFLVIEYLVNNVKYHIFDILMM